MRMQFKKTLGLVFLIAFSVCALAGCGEEKNPSKPSVVSKRISVKSEKESSAKAPESKKELAAKTEEERSELPETVVTERIYDPNERVNPFLPLFRTQDKTASVGPTKKAKSRKRIPQTPLERISIDQLKLVAIIRATSGNKALVEDSSGKGYIIKKGTYIGLNAGIVKQINKTNVIVEEELENLMGELVLQDTEIKLQKPAGE